MDPKVILFDGHEPHLSVPLVQVAKAKGIKTVLDAGSVHEGTKALIHQVDYPVCSENFAHQFTGESDGRCAADRLSTYAPSVVVTLGEQGLVWRNPQSRGAMSAFDVEAVDTTGAGDAFHGAFAACLAANLTWGMIPCAMQALWPRSVACAWAPVRVFRAGMRCGKFLEARDGNGLTYSMADC